MAYPFVQLDDILQVCNNLYVSDTVLPISSYMERIYVNVLEEEEECLCHTISLIIVEYSWVNFKLFSKD